ncbi:MAG: hypothetical protein AAFV87_03435 [Pseudomonadota bacterium]
MFRLIRTILLVLLAFVAGMLFERQSMAESCRDSGGRVADGLCWSG